MARRAALFGKLPSHGDFVARNLDPDARQAWDDWASRGLEAARERLRDDFEPAHDVAPPWRFQLGPGRFGAGWRAGALAPSVDSAGRRFFIMLAADDLSPSEAALGGETAASELEEALYLAFAEGLTADALVARASDVIATLDWTGEDAQSPGERWWTGDGHRLDGVDVADPDLVTRILTVASEA